jgi:hypothetical protein
MRETPKNPSEFQWLPPLQGDAVLTSLGRQTHVVFFSVSKNIFASSPSPQNLRCSLQRTSQQYIGVSIPLVGIILNPAPLLAAREPQ